MVRAMPSGDIVSVAVRIFVAVCVTFFIASVTTMLVYQPHPALMMACIKDAPAASSQFQRLQSSNLQHVKKLIFHGNSTASLHANMTIAEADLAYWNFVSYKHYMCEDNIRLGNRGDGGWDMCLAPPFEPFKPCLVYSFGINNDFSFDDEVSKRIGCTVRAFDPSMAAATHRRDNNIWFFKIGLGGEDVEKFGGGGWTLKTLQSLIKYCNDTGKIIDYLKADIEGSEWPSFEQILKNNGTVLDNVKQLALEVHHPLANTPPAEFLRRYRMMKGLEDVGFRRWYHHSNPACVYKFNGQTRSGCYEIVYINTRFLMSPKH